LDVVPVYTFPLGPLIIYPELFGPEAATPDILEPL
jgi:hypothetical protein